MKTPTPGRLIHWLGAGTVLSAALAATPVPVQAAEPATPAPAAGSKPNIVILLADDWGWGYPGFTGGLVDTPNLNKMAEHSLNLTQFYVQPVCTPSRACLLTGRYPFRTGTEGRFTGNDTSGMLRDERTVAQGLHEAGYHTAIFGKWHLGAWYEAQLPTARGFDYQYGFYGAMVDYYRKMRLKKAARYEEEAAPGEFTYDWHRNQQPLVQNGYTTYLIADEVVSALENHDPNQPFFYYVAFNAAHGPSGTMQIPPEMQGKFGAARYAQAYCMDQSVGKIMAALDKNGLTQNTLVIFFNDNGGVLHNQKDEHSDNAPYRGGKGSYYEGGMRVPCLVSWPAMFPEARKIDAMVDVVDIYPTLINLAGGSLDQPLPVDGKDMMPLLKGQVTSIRDEIAYSTHVLRKGDWKLIAQEQGYAYAEEGGQGQRPGDELYNIATDPYEKHNVAAENPQVVAQLKDILKGYAAGARTAEEHQTVPGFGKVTIFGEKEAPTFPGVKYVKSEARYIIEPVKPGP